MQKMEVKLLYEKLTIYGENRFNEVATSSLYLYLHFSNTLYSFNQSSR